MKANDEFQRYYEEGFLANKDGLFLEACPYTDAEESYHWWLGFTDARQNLERYSSL